MKDLPLIALRALAAVHAGNGVRAAASQLGIAHSSVSRHLVELENWLGLPLVDRGASRRGFALTPTGDRLAATALASLQSLTSAVASLREVRDDQSVVITTAPSFAARWLLPRIPLLHGQRGAPVLSVVAEQRIVDLSAGNLDLAVRIGRGPWPELHCEPLMDDALYPVASPTLLDRVGAPATPRQWSKWPLLHDRDPPASWAAWRDAHGPRDLDVRRGPRFTSSDLVLRAAILSQGVALARHRLAADDIASGALVRPFGARYILLPNAYWLVMPSRSVRHRATMSAVAWLKSQAASCGPAR